jgi:hypothetical protein
MKLTPTFLIPTLAFGIVIPAAGALASGMLPNTQTRDGITYMSGGFGKAEADAMKEEAKHYPLSIIFSENKNNEYLADVDVVIRDTSGKIVLNAPSSGPIMLVRLPEGKYTIAAEAHGKTLHRTAKVTPMSDRRLYFHWPHA